MRWGWLLPDASYQVLNDGWERQAYRPRHGRPPLMIRGANSAAMAFWRARERYLGAADEEFALGAGVQAVTASGAAASGRAPVGAAAGARATAGAAAGRPRSADLSRFS